MEGLIKLDPVGEPPHRPSMTTVGRSFGRRHTEAPGRSPTDPNLRNLDIEVATIKDYTQLKGSN